VIGSNRDREPQTSVGARQGQSARSVLACPAMPTSHGDGAALGVIPARYGASRFPGKPLAILWGKPLVQHVWERARTVAGFDSLVVATDDERIADAARGFGARVEMTPVDCPTGTDRVAHVAWHHPEAAIIVNLQGDEPELDAGAVERLVAGMRADAHVQLATLAHREPDPRVFVSEHVVKVERDADDWALYFTRRWPAPDWAGGEVLRHIGVYGFRRPFLIEFASWPPGRQETGERLEQLRAVERGVRIKVYVSECAASGVDTPEQLAELERRGPRG
jgi:3-deoxy-manno-octulosonate cytidylyltransferase (CMP-KDO synthetase)